MAQEPNFASPNRPRRNLPFVDLTNGWLTLTGVCDEVSDVMEMTGFSCFFKAFKDIPEAVAALKKGEGPKC